MNVTLFDERSCALGEGPLWHPGQSRLFWFDILGKSLLSREADWTFEEMISAAGWVDETTLLIASETALMTFDTGTGASRTVVDLEADRPGTRSNDGRADPWGGFWIGTMGKSAEKDAGAIYRYYRGTLRRLVGPLSIPNAICFAPDRSCAYFSDSGVGKIYRVALAAEDGWLAGEPALFRDLAEEDGGPDGAVVDADGLIWNAQWGGSRVVAYDRDARFVRSIQVPPRHSSCPAFGGPDLRDLYVTSARHGIPEDVLAAEPANGQTFEIADVAQGLPEYQVIL